MSLLVGACGFIIGLFLWSNIYGSIFGTYPVEKKMVKAGLLEKIGWGKILGAIAFALLVLVLTAIFAKTFFYGTLVAAIIMLFNIGKLRAEAIDNFQMELNRNHEKASVGNK